MVKLPGFFSLILVCLFGMHYLINSGLRRIQTGSFGVSNRIVNGQVNADILISGSSRAFTHYDPRIIQQRTGRTTFNIGLNGSQTDMQLARLKTYLEHNRRPSLVIHNLDLFSFVITKEVYDPAQYLPYLDEEPIYDSLKKINPAIWIKSRYLPLYGYAVEDMRFTWMLGVKRLFGWNPPENLYRGFLPRRTAWTGDFDRFKDDHPDGVEFEIEPEGIRDLEELVALCRGQGIAVLLVYSPEYYEMQKLERNRDGIFTRFKEIAEKYGADIWDFSDSPICYDKDNFYNSQHLNAEGAGVFSRGLALRLRSDPALVDVIAPELGKLQADRRP